jgi:competence protein ComEC
MLLAHRAARTAGQRAAAWGVVAALGVAALAPVWPRAVDRPRNAMLVEAIDVGQGDSILLIAPDGRTLLIDGGGFGGGPRLATQNFDIGEEVVSHVLWARGIRHLDAVALTHAHSDHMGGLPAVLRNFHPAELWVGNNPHSAAYDALLGEAAALGVRVRPFAAGEQFGFGVAQVRVLAPEAGYRPGAEAANDDSLVLRVAYGQTSILLMGDAERPVEERILATANPRSSLLKVGHHGSRTSTSSEFLGRVAPGWALISCGRRNRYGHPNGEILDRLEDAHVVTLSTDLNGASCFQLDGGTVRQDLTCQPLRIP